ncbi:hypothetical protein B0T17DRAFT_618615 [Bombardia bombarda]|uniref:Uncharacterized protein n=1 Tax=Bombardia bombarda TaxID=252184 RepID=A0AA39WMA4_9PEZI|nr:hypothetical protein B0T17DRAFT_618615 [Bombardia bombarda]
MTHGGGNERRQILGLTVPLFWAIVVSLILIIAAGIGGGYWCLTGESRQEQHQQRRRPTQQPVDISTNSCIVVVIDTIVTIVIASFQRDRQPDNHRIRDSDHHDDPDRSSRASIWRRLARTGGWRMPKHQRVDRFQQLCEINYPSGADYGNPGIFDIMKLYLPSLEQCMAACATYNLGYKSSRGAGADDSGFCSSVVVIKTGETSSINGTGINNTRGSPKDYTSAVLVSE